MFLEAKQLLLLRRKLLPSLCIVSGALLQLPLYELKAFGTFQCSLCSKNIKGCARIKKREGVNKGGAASVRCQNQSITGSHSSKPYNPTWSACCRAVRCAVTAARAVRTVCASRCSCSSAARWYARSA